MKSTKDIRKNLFETKDKAGTVSRLHLKNTQQKEKSKSKDKNVEKEKEKEKEKENNLMK